MDCCTRFAKFLLCLFNFVFFVSIVYEVLTDLFHTIFFLDSRQCSLNTGSVGGRGQIQLPPGHKIGRHHQVDWGRRWPRGHCSSVHQPLCFGSHCLHPYRHRWLHLHHLIPWILWITSGEQSPPDLVWTLPHHHLHSPDRWDHLLCGLQKTGGWPSEEGSQVLHHQLVHDQGLQGPDYPDLGPCHVQHGVLRCQQLHWLPRGQEVCVSLQRGGAWQEGSRGLLHPPGWPRPLETGRWQLHCVALNCKLISFQGIICYSLLKWIYRMKYSGMLWQVSRDHVCQLEYRVRKSDRTRSCAVCRHRVRFLYLQKCWFRRTRNLLPL